MRALTVRPPWSDLIAAGVKPIENRTWRIEPGTRLWLHAGVNVDRSAWDWPVVREALPRVAGELVLGAVIASFLVKDVHTCDGSCSPWALPGVFHHEIADVRRLERPVPCRGQLGLWTPPADLLAGV